MKRVRLKPEPTKQELEMAHLLVSGAWIDTPYYKEKKKYGRIYLSISLMSLGLIILGIVLWKWYIPLIAVFIHWGLRQIINMFVYLLYCEVVQDIRIRRLQENPEPIMLNLEQLEQPW